MIASLIRYGTPLCWRRDARGDADAQWNAPRVRGELHRHAEREDAATPCSGSRSGSRSCSPCHAASVKCLSHSALPHTLAGTRPPSLGERDLFTPSLFGTEHHRSGRPDLPADANELPLPGAGANASRRCSVPFVRCRPSARASRTCSTLSISHRRYESPACTIMGLSS